MPVAAKPRTWAAMTHSPTWPLALAALLGGTAVGQRQVLRHDAAAYVCTEEGTNWTYLRTTTPDGAIGGGAQAIVSVGEFGTYRRADGSRWHLVAQRAGERQLRQEHWNTEGPGLLVVNGLLAMEGHAKGTLSTATACLLAAPVGAVTAWNWNEDRKEGTVEVRAAVLAFDEQVKVPVGTFRAVHVQIAELADDVVKTDLWFARGTGLVRSVRQTKDHTEVTELTKFTPGSDQTELRLSTLQMLAPPDWLWSKRGAATITWFDREPTSVLFGGRFALINNHGTWHCAFVDVGRCLPISAAAIDWREIQQGRPTYGNKVLMQASARLYMAERQLFAPEIDIEADEQRGTLQARDAKGLRRFDLAMSKGGSYVVTVTETKD